jgi:hypothetical protein
MNTSIGVTHDPTKYTGQPKEEERSLPQKTSKEKIEDLKGLSLA